MPTNNQYTETNPIDSLMDQLLGVNISQEQESQLINAIADEQQKKTFKILDTLEEQDRLNIAMKEQSYRVMLIKKLKKLIKNREEDQTQPQFLEKDELFQQWQTATEKGIVDFLEKVKINCLEKVRISTTTIPSTIPSIMISYAKKNEDPRITETINKLKKIFNKLGIKIAELEYESISTLKEQLSKHTHAIVLATREYKELAAATVEQEKVIKETLDEFGRQKDFVAKLHVLLCDNGETELCLMSELQKDDIPLKGKLYLEKKDNKLRYIYLNNKDEKLEGSLDIEIKEELTKEILINKKKEILKITTEKKHALPDGFRDIALKIIEDKYLIRNYIKVFNNESKLTSDFQEQQLLLEFIDHLFNPSSYAYGIGMLPSILDLSDKEHDDAYKNYKKLFADFYKEQQQLNLKYRFKKVLLNSYQKNLGVLKHLASIATVKTETTETSVSDEIKSIIEKLVQDRSLKTNLILCQGVLDETLINWLIEAELMTYNDHYVLSIDCGRKYKIADQEQTGSGVLDFLKEKLCLKQHEIEKFTKQKEKLVIILFKNYDRLGVYENLYVKNQLSKWPNLKVIVTCDNLFFQHRSYESCFLPDPGVIDLSSITCDPIKGIFTAQDKRIFISEEPLLRTNSMVELKYIVNEKNINKLKLLALHTELSNFLKNINKAFKVNGTLAANTESNPQIFISYAWEREEQSRTRQQNHLKQIAKDLYTLGFLTWLDLERMIGNIDQQMQGNIGSSRYVLLIGTPLYTQRSGIVTNVQKEFSALMNKKEVEKGEFTVFPIEFLPKGEIKVPEREDPIIGVHESFPADLQKQSWFHDNLFNFCDIDDGEEYIKQLTSLSNPKGLIPRLLKLFEPGNETKHTEYDKYYQSFQQQLQLVPASHLLVDKGQNDVQAYDIDGRLEVYIEPSGVKNNPAINTTKVQPDVAPVNLESSLSDFLKHDSLKTYVALGDAGSGKTLFTLWTFKKYVLQPWHNYRNKELKIYLCKSEPQQDNIEPNAIYLFLSATQESSITKQIQYTCIVKNYKHENDGKNDGKKELQKITIDATNLSIYTQIKQQLASLIESAPTEQQFTSDYEKNEFFNLLKPKWLPIYIPLKNYAYPGKDKNGQDRKKDDKQTPLNYIEDALLTDYHLSPQDILNLKKGLYQDQHILFILDGYDELVKGNNPNFSQALLNGVEDVLLCLQKPTELKKNHIYVYLNGQAGQEKVQIMFNNNVNTLIDQPITNQKLATILKTQINSLKDSISLIDAAILEEFFKYTYEKYNEKYKRDLTSHTISWKHAKIFVTGRPEHFDNEQQHSEAFSLLDNQQPIPGSFSVTYMARFTPEEIETYITKYKEADQKCADELDKLEKELAKLENVQSKTTFAILESFGNLKELLTNPFLLNITLQALPILIKKTNITINRANVYEAFIEYWYTKEIARKEQAISRNTQKAITEDAKQSCYQFSQQLVMQMFIANTISISEKSPALWQFFNNLDNTFARENCPLRRSGNEYSFIHKSVYEYLLTRYLLTTPWEDIQTLSNPELGYNASVARLLKEEPSVFSFIQDFARPFLPKIQQSHIPISLSSLQEENLYAIFLELLGWNEIKLAERLITGKTESSLVPAYELSQLAYKSLLKEDATLITDILISTAEDETKEQEENSTAMQYRSILINYKTYQQAALYLHLLRPFNPKHLQKQLNILLNLVGFGEQDAAEQIIKLNPELAVTKGNLIDCTNRLYKNISALQYAVWALDYHMWTMILKYLNNGDLQNKVRTQLKELPTLSEKGFIITQDINNRWPSLSWHPLIEAYNKYLNEGYNAEVWRKQVSGAQLLLPAHIINEYSHPNRPNGFEGCTWGGHDEGKLPRTGVIGWREWDGYILGTHFAWVRGWDDEASGWTETETAGGQGSGGRGGLMERQVEVDGRYVNELMKARVEHAQMLLSNKLNLSHPPP